MNPFNELAKWARLTFTSGKGGSVIGSFFGRDNWSGEPVNVSTTMALAAAWACVHLRASTIASLPFGLIDANDDGGSAEGKDDTDSCIRRAPNPDQTSMDFWESMIAAMDLQGNGFAKKLMRGAGAEAIVIGLEFLQPWRTSWRCLESGRLEIHYRDEAGGEEILSQDQVFHLRGFSLDGRVGCSTISYGANTFGGARAADRTATSLFKSGMSASGFLETGQVLNEKDRERLQKVMDDYVGSGNAGRTMILEGGMKWNQMSMTADDSELLLSRKWNVEEICRWFGVPPVMIGHQPDGGTMWGSGVEQVILQWYMTGLRTTLERIEQQVRRQLLNPAQRVKYRPAYNVDALLEGDPTTRQEILNGYTGNGTMNRNEARKKLRLPPYVGGDTFTVPVNLAPADQLGDNAGKAADQAAVRRLLGVGDVPDPAAAKQRMFPPL